MSTEIAASKKILARQIKALADKSAAKGSGWTEADKESWDSLNAEFDALLREERLCELDPNRPPRAKPGLEDRKGNLIFGESEVPSDTTEARALEPKESCETYLRSRGFAAPEIRIGKVIRALVRGPRDDAERRALSIGTDSAGGFLTPEVLAGSVIDRMRAVSTVLRAGATIVPLTSDTTRFARVNADPTVAWRAENAAVAESDPTFNAIVFTPKTLAVMFKASRELAEDAPNFDATVENVLVQAMSVELDRAALEGTGASNQPTGLSTITTGNGMNESSLGANGATIANYDNIATLIQSLLEDNVRLESIGAMIMAPRTLIQLEKFKEATTNAPLAAPPIIATLPRYATSSLSITRTQGTSTDCSNIYLGDWAQLLVGIRTQVRILRLVERFADNLQVGFVAYARMDVALAHNEAVGRVVGCRP